MRACCKQHYGHATVHIAKRTDVFGLYPCTQGCGAVAAGAGLFCPEPEPEPEPPAQNLLGAGAGAGTEIVPRSRCRSRSCLKLHGSASLLVPLSRFCIWINLSQHNTSKPQSPYSSFSFPVPSNTPARGGELLACVGHPRCVVPGWSRPQTG